MQIAVDYDETYTADPEFWNHVVSIGRRRGHNFVCVTARIKPPEPYEPQPPMPVVCAGKEWKRTAAEAAGYKVDVWIDDLPEYIAPVHLIRFDDEGSAGCG